MVIRLRPGWTGLHRAAGSQPTRGCAPHWYPLSNPGSFVVPQCTPPPPPIGGRIRRFSPLCSAALLGFLDFADSFCRLAGVSGILGHLIRRRQDGVFGAWDRDPGHWEAVLPKNRSADLFRRFVGISSPIWRGGLAVPFMRTTTSTDDFSGTRNPFSGTRCTFSTCLCCPSQAYTTVHSCQGEPSATMQSPNTQARAAVHVRTTCVARGWACCTPSPPLVRTCLW